MAFSTNGVRWIHTALRRESSCYHQEAGLRRPAVLSLHNPLGFFLIPLATGDNSVEGAVFAKTQLLVYVVEVGLQFSPIGVVRRPMPIFIDFWNGEFVDWYGAVYASSWVDVLRQRLLEKYWHILGEHCSVPLTHLQVPPKLVPAS